MVFSVVFQGMLQIGPAKCTFGSGRDRDIDPRICAPVMLGRDHLSFFTILWNTLQSTMNDYKSSSAFTTQPTTMSAKTQAAKVLALLR